MHNVKEYNGALTPSQIADGMNFAARNSLRLYRSAKLLFDAEDYPTAASLAVLAIEEIGKVSILRGLAMSTTEEEIAQCWKEYKKHTEKSRMTSCLLNVQFGETRLEDYRGAYSRGINKVSAQLDNIKQFGFYTNCLIGPQWVLPENHISKESAQVVLMLAEIQCATPRKITAREIELWHDCLAPVRHATWPEMQQGVLKWHRQMVAEGLREDDDGFVRFVLDGNNFRESGVNSFYKET